MSEAKQERAAFEAWATANGFNMNARFESAGQLSQFMATQHAWEGWQGGTAGKAELLEALKAMVDAFQFTDESEGQYQTVQIARAAIAKAQGESA